MGFNTVLMVSNDSLHVIKQNPTTFADAVYYGTCGLNSSKILIKGQWVGDILSSQHADVTQVVAVGGNQLTELFSTHNLGLHRTEEQQVALLKEFANRLGYNISRKPEKGRKNV